MAASNAGTAAAAQDDYPPLPGPGGYAVVEDSMRDAINALNANADRQRNPFYVQAMSFTIERDGGPDRTYEDKKVLSELWAVSVADLLEDNGFKIAEDWKLRHYMGLSAAEFRQRMLDSLPYGGRDLAERHAGTGIYILLNEHPPGCSGDNGFMALVLPYYPTEGVASDYGGLMAMIGGAGTCAANWNSRAVLNEIASKVRRAVSRAPEARR